MREMEALVKMFKSLVSDTLAIPVPELLIEQTLVLFKLPVPGLGRFCSANEYSHYWFVTHTTPPRMSMCCLTCTSPSS